MKMKNVVNYLTVITLAGSLFSCVPQRQLEEEQAKRENCEKELAELKTKSQDCETKLTEANKLLLDNKKMIDIRRCSYNPHSQSGPLMDCFTFADGIRVYDSGMAS